MGNFTSRIDYIGPKHYRIVINMKDEETGKYRKKRRDVHGTKPEAELVRDEMLYELEQGPKKLSDTPTGEYLLYWINTVMQPNLERNTYESYRWEIENHIKPSIGHIPLCEISPLHIQTLYTYLLEAGRKKKPKDDEKADQNGLSNRSVAYKHSILNQALKYAVRPLKLINENPCDEIKPPRNKKSQKEKMLVLSNGDLKSFLDNIRSHPDFVLIYTTAYTGMRISEVLALRWSDILWEEKKIRVEMTMHRLQNGEYEHRPRTKNTTSTRTIDVTDSVLSVLRLHEKTQVVKSINKNNSLVFPKKDGTPQDRRNISKRFSNIAAKMGYKGMRFHDLRHTHATILLESGEMVNAVSERLGHGDISTTLRIYGHVLPKKAKDTAARFEQLMQG